LLSLYEQSKQRLQVRVDAFGDIADQTKQLPPDDATLQKAIAFMIPLADAYGDGKVTLEDLKKLRNKNMKILTAKKSAQPKSSAKKRPSAKMDIPEKEQHKKVKCKVSEAMGVASTSEPQTSTQPKAAAKKSAAQASETVTLPAQTTVAEGPEFEEPMSSMSERLTAFFASDT
jgi:hypothetical protein